MSKADHYLPFHLSNITLWSLQCCHHACVQLRLFHLLDSPLLFGLNIWSGLHSTHHFCWYFHSYHILSCSLHVKKDLKIRFPISSNSKLSMSALNPQRFWLECFVVCISDSNHFEFACRIEHLCLICTCTFLWHFLILLVTLIHDLLMTHHTRLI